MQQNRSPLALVTGGSRGIGAATALALAERGYDLVITFRNKAARAAEVAGAVRRCGSSVLALQSDITQQEDLAQLFAAVKEWRGQLDVLVLNASGGLERDLVEANPAYPMLINRDAQLALLDGALPLMPPGATVVFVTSHWAHLFGQIEHLPAYGPVAETKHAGELALRARQAELTQRGIRLLVVTGDLVEGTITPRLLERASPGLTSQRKNDVGNLPTTLDMANAIAAAATDATLPTGYTIVVGGDLASLPPLQS